MNKEIDKLNDVLLKIQNEKRELENEVIVFNEKKESMVKCEMQMNEILNMVNEERLVRDHLKILAKKLIDEVDSLRAQCMNNNNLNGRVLRWLELTGLKRVRICVLKAIYTK